MAPFHTIGLPFMLILAFQYLSVCYALWGFRGNTFDVNDSKNRACIRRTSPFQIICPLDEIKANGKTPPSHFYGVFAWEIGVTGQATRHKVSCKKEGGRKLLSLRKEVPITKDEESLLTREAHFITFHIANGVFGICDAMKGSSGPLNEYYKDSFIYFRCYGPLWMVAVDIDTISPNQVSSRNFFYWDDEFKKGNVVDLPKPIPKADIELLQAKMFKTTILGNKNLKIDDGLIKFDPQPNFDPKNADYQVHLTSKVVNDLLPSILDIAIHQSKLYVNDLAFERLTDVNLLGIHCAVDKIRIVDILILGKKRNGGDMPAVANIPNSAGKRVHIEFDEQDDTVTVAVNGLNVLFQVNWSCKTLETPSAPRRTKTRSVYTGRIVDGQIWAKFKLINVDGSPRAKLVAWDRPLEHSNYASNFKTPNYKYNMFELYRSVLQTTRISKGIFGLVSLRLQSQLGPLFDAIFENLATIIGAQARSKVSTYLQIYPQAEPFITISHFSWKIENRVLSLFLSADYSSEMYKLGRSQQKDLLEAIEHKYNENQHNLNEPTENAADENIADENTANGGSRNLPAILNPYMFSTEPLPATNFSLFNIKLIANNGAIPAHQHVEAMISKNAVRKIIKAIVDLMLAPGSTLNRFYNDYVNVHIRHLEIKEEDIDTVMEKGELIIMVKYAQLSLGLQAAPKFTRQVIPSGSIELEDVKIVHRPFEFRRSDNLQRTTVEIGKLNHFFSKRFTRRLVLSVLYKGINIGISKVVDLIKDVFIHLGKQLTYLLLSYGLISKEVKKESDNYSFIGGGQFESLIDFVNPKYNVDLGYITLSTDLKVKNERTLVANEEDIRVFIQRLKRVMLFLDGTEASLPSEPPKKGKLKQIWSSVKRTVGGAYRWIKKKLGFKSDENSDGSGDGADNAHESESQAESEEDPLETMTEYEREKHDEAKKSRINKMFGGIGRWTKDRILNRFQRSKSKHSWFTITRQ